MFTIRSKLLTHYRFSNLAYTNRQRVVAYVLLVYICMLYRNVIFVCLFTLIKLRTNIYPSS